MFHSDHMSLKLTWLFTVVIMLAARPALAEDVPIGYYEFTYDVELAVHEGTGNLFAVALGSSVIWEYVASVHHSTDGGRTWSTHLTFGGSDLIRDASCAVMGNYFYVIYSGVFGVRLYRYRVSDGQPANFPAVGSSLELWSTAFTNIELVSTEGFEASPNLYAAAAVGGLIAFRSTFFGDVEDWVSAMPGAPYYSRGLALCGGKDTWRTAYLSYYDSSDHLRIWRYRSYTWEQVHGPAYVGSDLLDQTAMAMYGDTVICVKESGANPVGLTLIFSYDGGDSWNTQTIYHPSNSSVNPAVSCLGGDGIGLVYAELGLLSSKASLRHRPCADIMLLSAGDAIVFNESAHRMRIESAPDIEPLGQGRFGVAWVGTSTNEYRPYFNVVSCCELRGDVDHSGALDISDLTYFVDYLFGGGPAAPCEDEADIDYSGTIDISDLTFYVDYLFGGGPPPPDCW